MMHWINKKDIHKRNYLIRWGILFAIIIFVILIFIISMIDFTFLVKDQNLVNLYIKIILYPLCFFIVLWLLRKFMIHLANSLNRNYLKRFTLLDSVATYKESKTQGYTPKKIFKESVLLIHGFAASPQEFSSIIPKLKDAEMPYYVPHIIGFGLSHTQILHRTSYEDWFRNALEHYDILASLSEKVSVVGHSLGGIMASFIAERRNVHKLILSSPGLYLMDHDLKYKKLLKGNFLSSFYIWLIPYLPKPIRKGRTNVSDLLDETKSHQLFHYLAIPTHAIREIFKAQEHIQLEKIKAEKLYLIYGKQDLTVNNEKLVEQLDKLNFKYEKYVFKNSAHNCFEDYESEKASNLLVDILLKK